MKYFIVYQITNLITQRIYIGRHSTNNLQDNYMGSGTELMQDLKKFGRKNFKKDILFVFDNWKEMVDKETELLTEEFINSEHTYNSTRQGKGLITHTEEVREKLRQINTGLVSVKDKDGNNLKVTVDDPRYLSGELKHNTAGTVVVKDLNGKTFRVSIDDPRRTTGELMNINQGIKQTPERIQNRVNKNLKWWETHSHSEEFIERVREINKGKVNVVDVVGNEFRIDKDDPRIESGELTVACKGSVWIHNDELKKSRFVRPEKVDQFLNEGWIKGLVYYNKKKRFFVCKPELNIQKQITEDEFDSAFADGWVKGRLPIPNIGEKIKNSRKPGKWMHNKDLQINRIIYLELIDEYVLNGWELGRK